MRLTREQIENIQIDYGLIYLNYGEPDESKLGPTRGGGTFTVTKNIRDIEYDGRRGKTKGLQVLDEMNATLAVPLMDMSIGNLALAMPYATFDGVQVRAEGNNFGVIPGAAYIKNIALLAKVIGGGYKLIRLYNAMSESDFSFTAAPKAEGVINLEINAHWDPEDEGSILYTIEDIATAPEDSEGGEMLTLQGLSEEFEALRTDMVRPENPIKLMCLYYGYPSNINMVYQNDIASQIYSKYDIVVFGDGVQHPDHIVYADTIEIIRLTKEKYRRIEIFGYVPMGQAPTSQKLSIETMKSHIDEWIDAGATGIFLDEFGYDYLVSRAMQNEIVNYCHEHGLNVIANSWNYDWVFSSQNLYLDWVDYYGNPDELEPVIGPNDYFLFENLFSNIDETPTQKVADQYRLQMAVAYRQEVKDEYNMSYYKKFGTKSIALDGILKDYPEHEKLFTLGYLGAAVLGIDGYGASGLYWGAADPDFIHYNPSKMPELLEETKHFTNVKHTMDGETEIVYSQYDAEFPNATLRLIWAPDPVAVNDPTQGTRKILWNGVEKTTV